MKGVSHSKWLLLLWAASACVAASADVLKVGFSRVDITPPLGSYMPGYYKDRYAKQVLDPLQINCAAFSDGNETAFVMQIDTEEISDRVADIIRDAVADATKVRRDAILLHATHTHDGGCLVMIGADDDTSGDEIVCRTTEIDYTYVRMVTRRAVDAALNARADLKPARLSMARSVARRISFGRRYLMRDGKVRTNPGTGNPDAVRAVGNPPDEEVQVLRIDREGGKPVVIINFQTHPDVVGGETLTADWPGLTRTVFEAATFGEAHAMVINGTQGDVNHCNVMPRPGEMNGLKMDFDDVERGYDHARHMANVLAGAALSVWMKCVPLAAGPVRVATRSVRVPSHRARDDEEKNVAWAERIWALHEAGKDSEITKELGCTGMDLTTEVARAGRIRRLAKGPESFEIPLYGFSVGQSLAFGGFPGEPFNDIGKAVKGKSPFALTILACLTNGSKGYFPFSDTFKEDGYEAATSPFGPSVADDLIAGELRLLESLHGE